MDDPAKLLVAVDAVVFTVIGELQILLIKRKYEPFKGAYAIPGGFVKPDESLTDAVKRELQEETGVEDVFLKQIATYGEPKRDPRGRVISVAYLALIHPDRELLASTDAMDAKWMPVSDPPMLAFDHKDILADALNQLRYEIQTTNIAYQILPRHFTLTELQNLYETVLGKELDKRNFRKRIKELDLLTETNQFKREGAHRPAKLYRFTHRKYKALKEKMHVLL